MTISKLTPLFCALALSAGTLAVHAQDNAAQAAAREALAKQLFDMSGPSADTNAAASSMTAPDAKAKAKADKAAAKAKAKQDAADAEAKAKAAPAAADKDATAERAALMAALEQRNKSAATSNAAPAMAAADKNAAKPVVAVKPVAAPVAGPATNNYIGKELGMKELAAPALPISATKAQRLQALLDKYKADQLTPDEYHQQRAAILAEP